jgi:hypothetical protein
MAALITRAAKIENDFRIFSISFTFPLVTFLWAIEPEQLFSTLLTTKARPSFDLRSRALTGPFKTEYFVKLRCPRVPKRGLKEGMDKR